MVILNTIPEIKKRFPNDNPDLVKKILNESNLLIGEKILKGDEFLMPFNLGMIFIAKFKNQTVFDYIHFCKTGEFKKQNNIKTFNYLYKIVWTKGLVNQTKRSLLNNIYKLSASRYKIRRPLAAILKSGKDFYKDEEYIKRFGNVNKAYLSQFDNSSLNKKFDGTSKIQK